MAKIPVAGFIFKCDNCSTVSEPFYLPKNEDINEYPLPEGWEAVPNGFILCDKCRDKENGIQSQS
jgi:hypothetical protein